MALPNQEAIATKSTTDLVAKFPTADRLSASNELIERYADSPEAVVAAVIGGIVSEFDPNSYRINLYVAYTLARIRPGWRGTDQQFLELCELKKHAYYRDSTLYKRVNHAIAAFIHGDEERERRLIRACS